MLPHPPVAIEDARMRDVAEWLRSVGYKWPEIARRAHLEGHVNMKTRHHILCMAEATAAIEGKPVENVRDLLVRVFLLGLSVDEAVYREHVPENIRAAIEAMKLATCTGGKLDAPLCLLEYGGVFTVSDSVRARADDWVLLPSNDSFSFSSTITRKRGKRFLDLGTGSGLFALRAASTHDEAIGVDITARSVTFAQFNQRLNGLTNTRFVQGDLYAPVTGVFDVIVSNPPYVPHVDEPDVKRPTYYQGGRNGDLITREVLAGLETHLVDGGYCNILGMTLYWSDGSTNPAWNELTGYDMVLMNTVVPVEDDSIVGRTRDLLRKVEAERVEFGACVLRKHVGPKRKGWFVRGPWLEELDFDVDDLFEELAAATSDEARAQIAARRFGGRR
jgi:methylase of polypeptide subunit release factors